MQILLTVVSENYHTLDSSAVRGFESSDMVDLQVNVETDLGGVSSFVLDGKFYTVSETVSQIVALTGSGTPGSAVEDVATAVEYGDSVIHQTVLTVDGDIPVVSVGSAAGQGGLKVYDFPEGRINVLGVTANLSLAVAEAEQENFTDATPEGDIAIGTAITESATLGDATDVDLLPKTAFTMADYAKENIVGTLATGAQFDGTSTAKDANINVIVDAADIDDDASTAIGVTGTVTLTWINLGDY